MDEDVDAAIAKRAKGQGQTYTDATMALLRDALGLPQTKEPAMNELLERLSKWLRARYTLALAFPPDVVRLWFQVMQVSPSERALYDAALAEMGGDRAARNRLHQRIGASIKEMLGAKVIGTSPLLPSDELITRHSLLAPKDG